MVSYKNSIQCIQNHSIIQNNSIQITNCYYMLLFTFCANKLQKIAHKTKIKKEYWFLSISSDIFQLIDINKNAEVKDCTFILRFIVISENDCWNDLQFFLLF